MNRKCCRASASQVGWGCTVRPAPQVAGTCLLVLFLPVSACGGRSVGSTDSETDTTGGDTDEAVLELAVADLHACARLESGRIKCWGHGAQGQLGYGDTVSLGGPEEPAPTARGFVELPSYARQVTAGGNQTCALLEDGDVYCWGSGDSGRLGSGSLENIGDDETPASVGPIDLGGPAEFLSSGPAGSCAVLDSGGIRCWGVPAIASPGFMQAVGDDEVPADVAPRFSGFDIEEVAVGGVFACALTAAGEVYCWGNNSFGLGYGNAEFIGDDEEIESVGPVPLGGVASSIAAGEGHVCAQLEMGSVKCWGAGWALGHGLGDANIGLVDTPADHDGVDVGAPVVSMGLGQERTCVVTDGGGVRCWGIAEALGYGNDDWIGDDEPPASAGDIPLGASATSIGSGGLSACAVTSKGTARCWGVLAGRLGYGLSEAIGDDELPSSVGDVPLF